MPDRVQSSIEEHGSVLAKMPLLSADISAIASLIVHTFKNGNKIMICGNGGSAADSQHFAAELSGRYIKERQGLPAISLTTDSSALTAISNDYSFEKVFARQVEALGKKNDLLILISTSGNSPNLLQAAKRASELGVLPIALIGRNGGKLKALCQKSIVVPSESTPRIQEMHTMLIHIICEIVDSEFD